MSDSAGSIDQTNNAGLASGAHVLTQRRWYTHHGIYVGNGRVIHYAGLSRSLRAAPVQEVSCEEFADGHAMWVAQTPDASYVGEDAVRRAYLRLGEDRYRVMTNNCEHFCAWCLYGKGRSEQVECWTAPDQSHWPECSRPSIRRSSHRSASRFRPSPRCTRLRSQTAAR